VETRSPNVVEGDEIERDSRADNCDHQPKGGAGKATLATAAAAGELQNAKKRSAMIQKAINIYKVIVVY
jgi:hypothetical protein